MSEDNSQLGILQREAYFPTLIFFKDLSDGKLLNASLLAAIAAEQERDKEGMHRSNVKQAGAWHSQDDLNKREDFAPLVDAIEQSAQEAFDNLLYDPDWKPNVDNMWANVSPRHAFNRMHIHPGVIWSGVYYVQTPPKSGRLFFSDPRVQASMLRTKISVEGKKRPENWSEVYYEPIAGRLILFPAWLLHEVEPNLSDLPGEEGHRISISFNLRQWRRE